MTTSDVTTNPIDRGQVSEKAKIIVLEAESTAVVDSLHRVGSDADRIRAALFNMDACIETMELIAEHRDDERDGTNWDFALEGLRTAAKQEFYSAIDIADNIGALFALKLKVIK